MSESAGQSPGVRRRMRNALGRGATRFVPDEILREEMYHTLYRDSETLSNGDDTGNPIIGDEWDTLDKREEATRARHRADFPWLFEPIRGVRWDFDPILLRNLAQEAVWVGMMVQSITKEIAQTPWTITEPDTQIETAKRLKATPHARDVAGEVTSPEADEIITLLSNPNPDHDWTDLIEMWMADLLEIGSLTGVKAFPEDVWTEDADGDPQLATTDPRQVKPLAIQPSAPEVWTKEYQDRTGVLSGYWQFDRERHVGAGSTDKPRGSRLTVRTPTRFDRMEVIWSDHSPRSNRRYGMSPTLLVKDFLKLMDLTVEQEQQYFSKGSLPSGALVAQTYNRAEAKELREEATENMKGKPHKFFIMGGREGPVDWIPFSFNYQELQFMERMKWYARVIASVFQVPTAVVGIEPEQINYATFQGERGNFESNTLGPYLQKIERVVNNQIVWPHWGRDLQFEFQPGMSEERRAQISDRIRNEWDRDLITRNEARRTLGYDEVEDGEDGFKGEVATAPEPAMDPGGDLDLFSVEDETGRTQEVASAESVRGAMESVARESDSRESPNDPLRESGEQAQLFTLQPGDIEDLHEDIAEDVSELASEILTDADIQDAIEEFAAEPDDDTTEKSLNDVGRKLKEILQESDITQNIQGAIEEHREGAIQNAVESATSQTGDDVDMSAITDRVRERDTSFAADFADRMRDDIRDTVADGWEDNKTTLEIAGDLEEKAGEFTTHQAERIARTELQAASGEARNEFASQTDRVEQWITAGDGRVREAHAEMEGAWKLPEESFEVSYPGRGSELEDWPGNSQHGINCRCDTLLLERDEVQDNDHAGVSR